MKLTILPLIFTLITLSGCTQLRLHNDSADSTALTETTGLWHHRVLYESLEVSAAIDPQAACQGNHWQSVRSQHSLVSIPLTAALWPLVGPSALGTGLWTPSRVSITCQRPPNDHS